MGWVAAYPQDEAPSLPLKPHDHPTSCSAAGEGLGSSLNLTWGNPSSSTESEKRDAAPPPVFEEEHGCPMLRCLVENDRQIGLQILIYGSSEIYQHSEDEPELARAAVGPGLVLRKLKKVLHPKRRWNCCCLRTNQMTAESQLTADARPDLLNSDEFHRLPN